MNAPIKFLDRPPPLPPHDTAKNLSRNRMYAMQETSPLLSPAHTTPTQTPSRKKTGARRSPYVRMCGSVYVCVCVLQYITLHYVCLSEYVSMYGCGRNEWRSCMHACLGREHAAQEEQDETLQKCRQSNQSITQSLSQSVSRQRTDRVPVSNRMQCMAAALHS